MHYTFMWTLAQAVALIQELQPHMLSLNYHITLGGGVLNAGKSDKDLDLFVVPLNGYKSQAYTVLKSLLNLLGTDCRALRDSPDYGPDAEFHYVEAHLFMYCGKRIDVFIS